MHNLKEIRNDINSFKESLKKRFIDIDIHEILELDENNRKYIREKENFEKEKKDISKSKDKTLFEKSKKISLEIDKITKLQLKTKNKLDKILSTVPNIPHKDVPIGKDENSNIEILKSGTIKEFNFKPNS